jgi:hypothetical protein
MNQKSDITLKLAEILSLDLNRKSLKTYQKFWWVNPRNKSQGGLKLTEKGFDAMERAEIKHHKIKLEEKLDHTNQTVIKLDQYIDCPWFIHRNNIYVYSDVLAVQLILFSGNLKRFIEARVLREKVL